MSPQSSHTNYERQTIHSASFVSRTAHRVRMRKSLQLVGQRLSSEKILDYGCGSGVFLSELNELKPGCAIGYEPYMIDRCKEGLPIYSELAEIQGHAPYHTITVFEVMEHLQYSEIEKILLKFDEILSPTGVVIASVPIEAGPAVLLKELNRFRRSRKWKYQFFEFIRALFFGIAGSRENPDEPYMSHKGFDFRELIKFIESKGWRVEILCHSPLPIKHWYGNSQVFFMMAKDWVGQPPSDEPRMAGVQR